MLSLPDLKTIVKAMSPGSPRPAEDKDSAESDVNRLAGFRAFLVEVAVHADLDLLGLIETDARGKAAAIIAAGRSGLSTTLSLPSLEDRGPLAKLLRENRARGGNSKILVSNEVFPRDGNWCDLVPMDSSVRFFFQPLCELPVPGLAERMGAKDDTRLACLAVDESDDGGQGLKMRALLAASLIANLRTGGDEGPDAESRAERVKLLQRLTSSIAHEIKNPLTGISAGVQYLARKLQPGVTEEETVDFIIAEIGRLNRMVDDLYSVSKPPPLLFVGTDIGEVINKSLLCLSEEVLKREISTEVLLDQDAPAIKADPDRLQQVFINLVKNAIEASRKKGRVTVEMKSAGGAVRVAVRDAGCGIPPEEMNRIFEPFHSTKSGGTGLGLYLSRSIVERHGGTIEVDAAEGGGTVFTVALPVSEGPNG
jgi:signal transduction histidine kinase